ncbi:GNAT family N-acetyltransferase, partial [bacterium]|nr:GNAT family N-acetyltransferase [bacterium]
HITWHDLAEVKSLAVVEAHQGRGLARALVNACLDEARRLELAQVFALTAVVELFLKLGFAEVEKSQLPHKIWGECVRCPKFPDCDEVAVLFHTGVLPTVPKPAGQIA